MDVKKLKKLLKSLHTVQSFKKHGLKQLSTWAGLIAFVCVFDTELLTLVHNVLNSANLAEKIATGLSSLVLIAFNKIEKK